MIDFLQYKSGQSSTYISNIRSSELSEYYVDILAPDSAQCESLVMLLDENLVDFDLIIPLYDKYKNNPNSVDSTTKTFLNTTDDFFLKNPSLVNKINKNDTYKIFSTIITRNADLIDLKYIKFMSLDIPDIETFENKMKDGYFELMIGNQVIEKLYFSFLMQLNKVKKCENSFYIKIPSDHTFGILIMILFKKIDVTVNIKMCDDFDDVRILTNLIYCDTKERHDILKISHSRLMNNIFLHGNVNCDTLNINYDIKFDYEKFSSYHVKGFFIEGNLDNISSFNLSFDGYNGFEYVSEMFELLCNKISNKLLYVPHNNDQYGYKLLTLKSYIGSFDYTKIKNIKLNIKLKNLCAEKINIYLMVMNFFNFNEVMTITTEPLYDNYDLFEDCDVIENFGSGIYSEIIPNKRTNEIVGPDGWKIMNKQLNIQKNIICPILQDYISFEYCECYSCGYNYDYRSMRKWLEKNETCPVCRNIWNNKTKFVQFKVNNFPKMNDFKNLNLALNIATINII